MKSRDFLKNAIWFIVFGLIIVGPAVYYLSFSDVDNAWVWLPHPEYNFSIEYPEKWEADYYGSTGYRGSDETKVLISGPGFVDPLIEVQLVERFDPTLDMALKWQEKNLDRINQRHRSVEEPYCEMLASWDDRVGGQEVVHRRYRCGNNLNEDVYFVRDRDFIIISLQADIDRFEIYQDEFERIVGSFLPYNL